MFPSMFKEIEYFREEQALQEQVAHQEFSRIALGFSRHKRVPSIDERMFIWQ